MKKKERKPYPRSKEQFEHAIECINDALFLGQCKTVDSVIYVKEKYPLNVTLANVRAEIDGVIRGQISIDGEFKSPNTMLVLEKEARELELQSLKKTIEESVKKLEVLSKELGK